MQPSHSGDVVSAISKAVPPVGVTVTVVAGVSLQNWVLIATLIYTVLQIIFLIVSKLDRKEKAKRRGR